MAEANDPDPRKFFKKLVCEFNSKVKFNNPDIEMIFLFRLPPEEFFRKHEEYFIVFEDDNGKAVMVGARLRGMQLCVPYGLARQCTELVCQKLHLCRDFVGGYCRQGVNCRHAHTLQSPSNKKVLTTLGLCDSEPPYPEEKLLNLLRMSIPQVCGWYNNRGCPNADACTRFHVCRRHVIGKCDVNGQLLPCDKSHTFDSAHSRRLLRAYGMENKSEVERKNTLLIHKSMPKTDVDDHVLDDDLRALIERVFGDIPPKNRAFRNRRVLPKVKPQIVIDPVPGQLNMAELEMIQGALGEEDLSEFLANQQLVEGQAQAFAEQKTADTKRPERNTGQDNTPSKTVDNLATANQAAKDRLFRMQIAQDTAKHNLENPSGLTAEEEALAEQIAEKFVRSYDPKARIAWPVPRIRSDVLPMYTGEAPQGDMVYICERSVTGTCPLESADCQDMHFVSDFLWQVCVNDRWYNLDTVNDEIETAHKERKKDYPTQVPREAAHEAGELLMIMFRPILRGTILRPEPINNIKVKVRRIGVRTKPAITIVGGRNELLRLATKKPRTGVERYLEGLHALMRPVRDVTEVVDTESGAAGNNTSGDVIGRFQWEIEVGDTWLPLVTANQEIEQAHKDKNTEYITMLPGNGETQFIAIMFATNTAEVLNAGEASQKVYNVRRVTPPGGESNSGKNTQQAASVEILRPKEAVSVEIPRPKKTVSFGKKQTKEENFLAFVNKKNPSVLPDEGLLLEPPGETDVFTAAGGGHRLGGDEKEAVPGPAVGRLVEGDITQGPAVGRLVEGDITQGPAVGRLVDEDHTKILPPTYQDVMTIGLDVVEQPLGAPAKGNTLTTHDIAETIPKCPATIDLDAEEGFDDVIVTQVLAMEDSDDDCDANKDAENTKSQGLVWQWQWRNHERVWETYHQHVSDCIEKHRREKKGRLKVDGDVWIINYGAETQLNKSTGKKYHIRRVQRR